VIELPAMVDAHSHAFQRALRGRAERLVPGRDDFWGWREAMYELAGALDPEQIHALSLGTYREMAAAGYGLVGEFHYVHHQPRGAPYEDPNAMAKAVAEAALEAGVDLVLLPAAYHRAGWDGAERPPEGAQRRFADPDVETFLARVDDLRAWAAGRDGVSVGVAAHSARAVPASWLEAIAAYADRHGLVRHVHAAEQVREVDEVRAEHGCSPIALLERTGFLGAATAVVHAVHVDAADIAALARTGSTVVSCPSTEGNLGDGHPPILDIADAGIPIAIGSDQNVVIDPLAEARELESEARRERRTRRALLARAGGDLWGALVRAGERALGAPSERWLTLDPAAAPHLAGVAPEDLSAALVTTAGATAVWGSKGPKR
jgi:formimidoylglutamate deiminase